MDKKLWLSLAAVLALAGCGGFNGGAVPDTRNRVTETLNTAQSTNQTATTNQIVTTTDGPGRSPESVATYGYINASANLPAGAPINGSAVLLNGTSVPLTRSTAVRLPTGNVTLVFVNTSWQGVIYAPSPANQGVTIGANRTTQISVSYTPLPRYGSLNVVAPGLPAGVGPSLTLTSGGWSLPISRAGLVPNLNPGSYVVQAHPVAYGGRTYTPTIPTQNVTITAYGTVTLNLAYTDQAAVQASRVNAILARAYKDNGQTLGLQCKQWVQIVVLDATHISVPGTFPNPDGYQWNSDPHFDLVPGGIRAAQPGDFVQMRVKDVNGVMEPHTFIIAKVNAPNLTVIESNFTKAGLVMERPNAIKKPAITFTSIEQLQYTVYRMNGKP